MSLRGRFRQTDQVGQSLICTVRTGRQLTLQAKANIEPPAVADLRFDRRSELYSGLSLNESTIDTRSTYFRSFSPRRYRPRSFIHPAQVAGPIGFG